MDKVIVSVKELSHRYSVQWAVKDVSFDITGKGVMGLLGSNGAGKSTTMNIICGVLNQTKGDVFIDGIDLKKNPVEAKKNIGFLPQKPPLYPDLTVNEYLTHCALLRFMPPMEIKRAVEVVKDRCSISHFSGRLIKNLSGGYQQRVGIAQAIVHNPKFVVLDEPTNGLDPNQIVEIRTLIKEISENHSILLSTHILSEVQAICDHINMIENGSLVFSGTQDEFDNYIEPSSFVMQFGSAPSIEALSVIGDIKQVEALEENRFRAIFNKDFNVTNEFIKQSLANNWDLKELIVERCSLDEVFAQLSGKRNNIK